MTVNVQSVAAHRTVVDRVRAVAKMRSSEGWRDGGQYFLSNRTRQRLLLGQLFASPWLWTLLGQPYDVTLCQPQ